MDTEKIDILDYAHFLHTLRALGAKMYHAPALHTSLLAAWDEPHRTFHSRLHLHDCLFHLEQQRWGSLIDTVDRSLIALALWFHDAVYNPKETDNEEKSAAWAIQSLALLSVSAEHTATIEHLILSTKGGYRRTHCPIEAWIHDIDLHVLGAPVARFAQYTQETRQEFAWVDDLNYRRGSDLILRRLITNPQGIYQTKAGRLEYEESAHKNILFYLENIKKGQMVLERTSAVEI